MHKLTDLTDQRERQARFARVQRDHRHRAPDDQLRGAVAGDGDRPRVDGVEPSVIHPYLLWRADTMRLARPR